MACVTFLTPAQRAALQAPVRRRPPAEIMAAHPAPPVTAGKLARLRLLAADTDPRIRQSAALNRHAPPDVLWRLAADGDVSIRSAVARNERAPAPLLAALGDDASPRVRGWVAANPATPPPLLESLAADADPTVRRIVEWARRWDSPHQPGDER